MSGVPEPYLTYLWRGDNIPDGSQIALSSGFPLYYVLEVTVSSSGRAHARGRMLRRDGLPGPSRGLTVDRSVEQPQWLADVLADADRLFARAPTEEGAPPCRVTP